MKDGNIHFEFPLALNGSNTTKAYLKHLSDTDEFNVGNG
jgi:hypothetical protein